MRDLTRVSLYTMLLQALENATEKNMDMNYENEIHIITQVFNTNIYMLRGIESHFVLGVETYDIEADVLIQQIIEKINQQQDKAFTDFLNRPQRKKPNKDEYVLSFLDCLRSPDNQWDAITVFSKLLDELHDFSEKMLNELDKKTLQYIVNSYIEYPETKNKVFLSYAYKDKLYSWGLYHYMANQGIHLYVDWMHTDASNDGAIVKNNLRKELTDSEQFLFLRTSNSELGRKDSQQIRNWCSWEFGNFYGTTSSKMVNRAEEKYYIQVYSGLTKKVSRKKDSEPSVLDGLKPLVDVKQGRLVG